MFGLGAVRLLAEQKKPRWLVCYHIRSRLDYISFCFVWKKRPGKHLILFINKHTYSITKLYNDFMKLKEETSNTYGFIVIVMRFFTISGKHVNNFELSIKGWIEWKKLWKSYNFYDLFISLQQIFCIDNFILFFETITLYFL